VAFESLGQCLSYKKGVVPISLPAKAPVCFYCLMGLAGGEHRAYCCRFTGEVIFNPKNTRGDHCPIIFTEEV